MSFVSIQLFEYFLWTHLHDRKKNRLFTSMILIMILFQPIAAALLLYPNRPNLIKILIGSYLGLLMLFWIFYGDRNLLEYTSHVGENGHLVWGWLTKNHTHWMMISIYLVFFFIPQWLSIQKFRKIFYLTFGTFLISLYFYGKYDTWGTMWCWTANIASLMTIFNVFRNSGWCEIKNT